MEKQAEETLLEQVKKTLGGYRDQVTDFWNDSTHTSALEQGLLTSKDFLKRYAAPAAVTTLGAGALAGGLTAQGERPGETKRERTMRILRNAAIASGATGLGWLGASGVAGLEPLTEMDSIADLTKEHEPRPLDTDIPAGPLDGDSHIPNMHLGAGVAGGVGTAALTNIPEFTHARNAARLRSEDLAPKREQYKKDLEQYTKDKQTRKTVDQRYKNAPGLYPGGKPAPKPSRPWSQKHGPISTFIGGKGRPANMRRVGWPLVVGIASANLPAQINNWGNNSNE